MNVYKRSILIIVVITIIGIAGFIIWNQWLSKAGDEKKPAKKQETIEEIIEKSVDTGTITTNLADQGFVQIKMKIITKSTKNAEKLTKLSFLTESTVIKYFNGKTKKDMVGADAIPTVEKNLKEMLNKELGDHFVTQVYVVEQMIQ